MTADDLKNVMIGDDGYDGSGINPYLEEPEDDVSYEGDPAAGEGEININDQGGALKLPKKDSIDPPEFDSDSDSDDDGNLLGGQNVLLIGAILIALLLIRKK